MNLSPHPPTEAVFLCPKERNRYLQPTDPLDPTVAAMVSRLPEHLRELWQERAAIREYEAGLTRELSEALALLDVIRMHPKEAGLP